jgi:hypothetical protein
MAKSQRHTPQKISSKLRKVEVKLAKESAIAQVCNLDSCQFLSPSIAHVSHGRAFGKAFGVS